MKKINRTNKTQEFKFSYKDLIQSQPMGAGQGLVLFFGGLLAKTAWAKHQEASLVAGGVLASHKLVHAQTTTDEVQPESLADNSAHDFSEKLAASTRDLLDVQVSMSPPSLQELDTVTGDADLADMDGVQFAANNAGASSQNTSVAGSAPEVQITVDLSDITLGTPERLATTDAPPTEFTPTAPAVAVDMSDLYLKFLGLAVGGGSSVVWADFAAGVVSSAAASSVVGGYVIDGYIQNAYVYRVATSDTTSSSYNADYYIPINGTYYWVEGGYSGLRLTSSSGSYSALPSSGGAINVLATTTSYDVTTGEYITSTLTLSAPYDTGTSQVVNPVTTLIQDYIDTYGGTSAAASAYIASSLGISTTYDLLYLDPIALYASSTGTTQSTALAIQSANAQIAHVMIGGTQALLASDSTLDTATVSKAVLATLTAAMYTANGATVDLTSSSTIDSLISYVTVDGTVYYTSSDARTAIATANDEAATVTTMDNLYLVQKEVQGLSGYTDADFQALTKSVALAATGIVSMAVTFSTSGEYTDSGSFTALTETPQIKVSLSNVSSLSTSNTYELIVKTYNSDTGDSESNIVSVSSTDITNGYVLFNLSDVNNDSTVTNLDTAMLEVKLGLDSGSAISYLGAGYLAFEIDSASAAITGDTSGTLTETDAAQSVSGSLSSASTFVAQTSVAGANGYGTFTIDTAGAWSYVMDDAHDEFEAGTTYTDSITVATAVGSTSSLKVKIAGTNDSAVISGNTTGSLTETNAVQTVTGTLSISDSDNTAAFVAQTSVSGANGYGKFTVSAAGAWSYVMNTAHNEFVSGTNYTDTLTVKSYDGTSQVITVTIAGANDVPTISGTSTGSVTEDSSTAATGSLTISDSDTGESIFATPATANLSGSYGTFTFSSGAWTYTLDSTKSAVQALASGSTLTDTLTVYSTDGTASQTITATVNGANDVPTITGTTTGSVTEDSATVASGTLTITDTDTSQSVFATPSSLAGNYGTFTFNVTTGAWTYTVDSTKSAVQALGSGKTATDTLTVYSIDGTASKTITATVTGVNDVPTITGTSTGSVTEDSATKASGTLTVTDTDTSESVFATPSSLTGSYGTFTFNATSGAWTYTVDSTKSAVQALASGSTLTDTLTVYSTDGTASQTITATVNGANDVPTITGTTTASLTEDSSTTVASGTLTVTDTDTSQSVFATPSGLAGNYGTFTFNVTTGAWTYTLDNTKTAVQALASGATATDTLTVYSTDGTASKTITATVTGVNDVPTITGTSTGSVTEDSSTIASGTLSVADTDSGESVFTSPTTASLSGSYGAFTFNATSGYWTYTVDSTKSAVQVLASGAPASDTLTVYSYDGTASKTITATVTGVNDVPTFSSTTNASTYYIYQGAYGSTITTVLAEDVDTGDSVTEYAMSYQSNDATSGYFTVDNSSSGAITFNLAGAISAAVDATDTNSDGLADSPFTIHVTATDSYEGVSSPYEIKVYVYMAVPDPLNDAANAYLPYTSSSWSFAPQTTTDSNGDTVSNGFQLTNTSYNSIYLNLSNDVSSLSFRGDGESLALSNDAITAIITDTSTSGQDITITTIATTTVGDDGTSTVTYSSSTTLNTLIQVLAESSQTITGTSDSEVDSGLGALSNFRDDTLEITDGVFSAASFSISGNNLLIDLGGIKTVTEVEAVKFSDGTTVRVVGANGYASFLEAMNLQSTTVGEVSSLGATSHAADGDYIYAGAVDPTSELSDLTSSSNSYGAYLEAVTIGTTDFYVYHG